MEINERAKRIVALTGWPMAKALHAIAVCGSEPLDCEIYSAQELAEEKTTNRRSGYRNIEQMERD